MKKKSKDITYEQFVAHLNAGNKGYMKKPRSWQKVWFGGKIKTNGF